MINNKNDKSVFKKNSVKTRQIRFFYLFLQQIQTFNSIK